MSVYVQQPGGDKRQEKRKSMISKLEKALKDTKTTFEQREKLYKETGQDIDHWTRGLLAQKVEFGAFMTSVKGLIEDKRDYTFDQWITLFCVKSRSDIYFCLRLFKNRKLLKREFGDNLEASVAESISTMNKIRKKHQAKTAAMLQLHANAAWAADLEKHQQTKEEKREEGVAKRKDTKDKKDFIHKAEKDLKSFIREKYDTLGKNLDDLKNALDDITDNANQSQDKKIKRKILEKVREGSEQYSEVDAFRRDLKLHLDKLISMEQASFEQVKAMKQKEIKKIQKEIEKIHEPKETEEKKEKKEEKKEEKNKKSDYQNDDLDIVDEDDANDDAKVASKAKLTGNPANFRKKLTKVLKPHNFIFDRAAKNDTFVTGYIENMKVKAVQSLLQAQVNPVFARSNKWELVSVFCQPDEEDVRFQVTFSLKNEEV